MPHELQHQQEQQLVLLRLYGEGSLEDVLASAEELEKQLRLEPAVDLLIDSRAYVYGPSVGDLRRIATRYVQTHRLITGRVAVLTNAGLQYGLGRMFTSFVELAGVHVRLFPTPEEAMLYLASGRPARDR